MKTCKIRIQPLFVLALCCSMLLLTACPSPQQEQSLTQIQAQISVLSKEVEDAFGKAEDEQIASYKKLNEDIRLLKKNQADAGTTNDQLIAALIAIEAKLDEYNARMIKLSERLNLTETALTERITLLSEQVNDIGRESTISAAPPTRRPQPTVPTPHQPGQPEELSPLQDSQNSESSQLYHQVYTAYVNGDFENAIIGFQKYTELYPDTEMVDIAQFWIAESFFSLGEYETALQEYDRLISKHPTSDKIPLAFFSKADAYLKLDRQIEAISHLKYILNQFPDTVAARNAAERLQDLGEN